jgi:cytochrome c-type biogenesis protein CcmE
MTIGVKLAIGSVVLAGVMAYLAYEGASTSWQYYVTVDECLADVDSLVGKRVRVSGRVAAGSLHIDSHRRWADFKLLGAQNELLTRCGGPLPDNLSEEMEVVVEGRLDSASHLEGDQVLTRCASKYESK